MHEVTVIKGHLGKAQQPRALLFQPLAGLQRAGHTSPLASVEKHMMGSDNSLRILFQDVCQDTPMPFYSKAYCLSVVFPVIMLV